jgi:hypothetical protein
MSVLVFRFIKLQYSVHVVANIAHHELMGKKIKIYRYLSRFSRQCYWIADFDRKVTCRLIVPPSGGKSTITSRLRWNRTPVPPRRNKDIFGRQTFGDGFLSPRSGVADREGHYSLNSFLPSNAGCGPTRGRDDRVTGFAPLEQAKAAIVTPPNPVLKPRSSEDTGFVSGRKITILPAH